MSDPRYDPADPTYRDETAVRLELARVFDICHGCGRCAGRCDVFPLVFDLLDGRTAIDLTPHEQDLACDTCVRCRACAEGCPYHPDIDWVALVERAETMRARAGQLPIGRTAALWWERFRRRVRTDTG